MYDLELGVRNVPKRNKKVCACITQFQCFTDNQPENLSMCYILASEIANINYRIATKVFTVIRDTEHHDHEIILQSGN